MEEKDKGVFSSGCPGCRRAGACTGCARREPRGKLLATDWLADIPGSDPKGLVEVMFKNTRVGFFTNPLALPLKIGDIVAVEASPGHDIGRVTLTGPLVALQIKKMGLKTDSEFKKVFRIARPSDIEKFEEARAREHSTMIRSRAIAEELGLAMKIGDVEYQGDGGKAIFYYIADERVDFRKLIRILAETFKVRIEMKQIGARQEAGRIGGIGPCGRPLCCSSWMNKFVSVGTGAARLQDLSMNPQKLAGQCAKLKCCLNFEIDSYAEAQKELPGKDIQLETKDGTFYLFKSDILSRMVTYSSDKSVPSNLVTISAARAFEIMALNKQGIRVDALDNGCEEVENKEYGDIIGQDSLTRFDRSKKKKKKKPQGGEQQNAGPRQNSRPNGSQQQNNRQNNANRQYNGKAQNGQRPNAPRQQNAPRPNNGKQQNQPRPGNSQNNGQANGHGNAQGNGQQRPNGQKRKPIVPSN